MLGSLAWRAFEESKAWATVLSVLYGFVARPYTGGDTLNKRAIEVGGRVLSGCQMGYGLWAMDHPSYFSPNWWIGNGPLRRLIHGSLLEGEDNRKVRDFQWTFLRAPEKSAKSNSGSPLTINS